MSQRATVHRPQWKAIAAMAQNRVIGSQNTIPWHFPEDFKWFKKNTLGATLVMGRKTYESIGKPLPKRTTVVLSRTAQAGDFPDGVHLVRTLDEVEGIGQTGPIWLDGGSEVYALGMPRCGELFLTIIQKDFPGDAIFPKVEHTFSDSVCLETSGPLEFWKFSR